MNHLKIPKPLFKDFIKYTITIVPFSIYISSVDGKLYSIFELPPTKKSIVYRFKFEVRCPVKRYKKNTSFAYIIVNFVFFANKLTTNHNRYIVLNNVVGVHFLQFFFCKKQKK